MTPPKNNSLKAKWKLAPGASLLLCCCISPDSRAGFWYICCFPSLLSSLGLASLTKEGASFHVRQAGLDTLEGPLWLSHGLVSRQSSNSLSGKQLGGLLQRFISPPSGSPQGVILSPGVMWKCLHTLSVTVTTGQGVGGGGCYWHLLVKAQECY